MSLSDFEIHVRRAAADDSYPVSARVAPQDRRVEGRLRLPLDDDQLDEAVDRMDDGRLDADGVRELGARLFEALFAGPVGELYRASRLSNQAGLRIRLVTEDPRVARVPWELLYDPEAGSFLARDGPLVRGLGLTEPTRPLTVQPPLRLLVVNAFPRGVLAVQEQLEAAGIRSALAGLARQGRVEVATLPRASLSRLQATLRKAEQAGRPFQLLHFIGHGRIDRTTGSTQLLFEDVQGDPDPVSGDELVDVVGPSGLRLVVLNASQTARASAMDLTRGLAPALLRSGVPAVVGMQATVLDDTAVAFARELYAAIGDGRPVDVALTEARRPARGGAPRRAAGLGIPVCYLRAEDGLLFTLGPAQPVRLTPATLWPWLRQQSRPRRLWAALVALIGLAASVIAVGEYLGDRFGSPPRMTGDLRIAVAEFGQLDGTGRVAPSASATDLATSIADRMREELGQLAADFDIQVRPPAETGRIDGPTPVERARQARELAARHNANVVVYGLLAPGAARTSITPEFYVDTLLVPNAVELAGDHQLGSGLEVPGDPNGNVALRQRLRQRVIERAQVLVQFTIGLAYYAANDFPAAERAFRRADRLQAWDERDGKEILYLFLGNVAGKQRRYPDARRRYLESLRLNSEYARAQVGLAEIRFHLASGRGHCERPLVDATGLQQAAAALQRARAAKVRPALSDIDVKIAFGLGRAYACISHAELADRWAEAEASFRSVVDAYRGGNTRVKQLAAESHAGLGLVHLPSPREPNARPKYLRAAEDYQTAISLADDPIRQAVFHASLGHIRGRLGDLPGSRDAYTTAARLDPGHREEYLKQLREAEAEAAP
jgi:tetratricopeptide (TPR) repeat protein